MKHVNWWGTTDKHTVLASRKWAPIYSYEAEPSRKNKYDSLFFFFFAVLAATMLSMANVHSPLEWLLLICLLIAAEKWLKKHREIGKLQRILFFCLFFHVLCAHRTRSVVSFAPVRSHLLRFITYLFTNFFRIWVFLWFVQRETCWMPYVPCAPCVLAQCSRPMRSHDTAKHSSANIGAESLLFIYLENCNRLAQSCVDKLSEETRNCRREKTKKNENGALVLARQKCLSNENFSWKLNKSKVNTIALHAALVHTEHLWSSTVANKSTVYLNWTIVAIVACRMCQATVAPHVKSITKWLCVSARVWWMHLVPLNAQFKWRRRKN